MTVKEFKEMIAAIDPADDNCLVLMPMQTDLIGIFAFEGVCSGISGMIELGPSPEFIRGSDENLDKPMRALLIAPHSFHDEQEHDGEGAQNNNEHLN